MRPIVIGIAGGTASGKTTVAHALWEALGGRAALVHHDSYYRSLPDGVAPSDWNFDHPDALETELLVAHVDQWRDGASVRVPRYRFEHHRRAPEAEWDLVPARPVLILEGILVLADAALRSRMHHRVYVHTADDLRLARRIHRDLRERGRTIDEVLDQYLHTVRPMHELWVAPTRQHAELELSGEQPVPALVERLLRLLP